MLICTSILTGPIQNKISNYNRTEIISYSRDTIGKTIVPKLSDAQRKACPIYQFEIKTKMISFKLV